MRRQLVLPATLAIAATLASCADATHDQQVAALGGEAPGVAPGPNHRPGQPCLVCHGSEGPAKTSFSVAGTVNSVFQQTSPAVGARVQIEDITGAVFVSSTNEVGNFYVATSQWQPTYPTQMQVSLGPVVAQMLTHAGREGSCAACHKPGTPGPDSAGPVYVATDLGQLVGDGGTGP